METGNFKLFKVLPESSYSTLLKLAKSGKKQRSGLGKLDRVPGNGANRGGVQECTGSK